MTLPSFTSLLKQSQRFSYSKLIMVSFFILIYYLLYVIFLSLLLIRDPHTHISNLFGFFGIITKISRPHTFHLPNFGLYLPLMTHSDTHNRAS